LGYAEIMEENAMLKRMMKGKLYTSRRKEGPNMRRPRLTQGCSVEWKEGKKGVYITISLELSSTRGHSYVVTR
jgi:hypothetical protein